MGILVNGQWQQQGFVTEKDEGEFHRQASLFRHWITMEGQAGPSGDSGFKAENDRYHLYVSLACPWAHRTLIFRALKRLEDIIPVSVVHPHMLDHGWEFKDNFPGATNDPLFKCQYAFELYTRAKPDYTGRVTVPILWDKTNNTIVSNESSDIIRMFNSAFNKLTDNTDDYYPEQSRQEIDELNERIYDNFNNGVYRCGFATTQEAYDKAIVPLFETLDWLEQRLATDGPYLCGSTLTETDWRLFTTLIRFDPVYYGHFKCNLKRIMDYPALRAYAQRLYNHPGVAATVNFDHIKQHYYYSHDHINPTRIVPEGPKEFVGC